MLFGLSRALVVFALCLSIGAHWATLQSVAWAGMLVQYSQHTSLAQAVAETFDGQHPCGLCKAIAGAQHSQKKSDIAPLTIKPDLICATQAHTLLPRGSDISFAPFTATTRQRVFSPPVPPPRSKRA